MRNPQQEPDSEPASVSASEPASQPSFDHTDVISTFEDIIITEAETDFFSVNFDILKEIINELTEQNLKRTHENIVDKFATRNVNNELAEEVIDIALDRKLIRSYRYARKLNYKINSNETETATIQDAVADVSVNTDVTLLTSAEPSTSIRNPPSDESYATTSQLSELKSDLLKEICSIAPQPQQHSQQEPLVSILLKHIDFLQNTITALVNKIDSQSTPTTATNIIKIPLTSPPVSNVASASKKASI